MQKEKYDVFIAGAGPGGLTCALYATRAGLCVAVVDRGMPGGQMAQTEWIDNYPGFPDGVSGPEISEKMMKGAQRFGAEVGYGNVVEVLEGETTDCPLTVKLDSGEEISANTFVLGTGARPRTLDLPGERRLMGRGVSYCAICDGNFFKDKEACVIGGGDSAVQEAVYLSKLCSKVTIVHRRDEFRASKSLQEAAERAKNVEIAMNSQIIDVVGEDKAQGVKVKDIKTKEERVIPCEGVFFYVGIIPQSDVLRDKVDMDDLGFVITDQNMETSWQHVYAVGDVRRPSFRQITCAVSDGTTAALAIDTAIHNVPDRWR